MSTVRPHVPVPSAPSARGRLAALWALPRPPIRRTSGRLAALAASVGALLLFAYLGVPWYLRSVLGLEHGGGG